MDFLYSLTRAKLVHHHELRLKRQFASLKGQTEVLSLPDDDLPNDLPVSSELEIQKMEQVGRCCSLD